LSAVYEYHFCSMAQMDFESVFFVDAARTTT